MIFNTAQYGHHFSPYRCLACIQLPTIHDKASLAWLLQYLCWFCPSGFANLLFFQHTQCSHCAPRKKKSRIIKSRYCRSSSRHSVTNTPFFFELFKLAADVHVQWLPSKFIHFWTYAEHLLMILFPRTTRHVALLWSVNIINSM